LAFILKRLSVVNTWTGKEEASGAKDYFNSILDVALSGQIPSAGATTA
jgi:hypothetical protein